MLPQHFSIGLLYFVLFDLCQYSLIRLSYCITFFSHQCLLNENVYYNELN